jgi:hypothetical protein
MIRTALLALMLLCSCIEYDLNEYQITTQLHGVPHACTITATYGRRQEGAQDMSTYETDKNGKLSIVFASPGVRVLEFFDDAGNAYPAKRTIRVVERAETIALNIELSEP